MARIRTIKPEFWTDETMVKLPFEARLLYIGLWNFCDDYGCFWDEPERIKMQIFPGDDFDAAKLLDLLAAAGRLERYVTEDGDRYWVVAKFSDHQRVDKPSRSLFPPREASRKLAIPAATRRAVAAKYGCQPGQTAEVGCYYCGELGEVTWWPLRSGKPSAWVSFSLELDHFVAESDGGPQSGDNFVLACRGCNRSKAGQDGASFLAAKLPEAARPLATTPQPPRPLASPREPSPAEGKGREGKGVEGSRPAAATPPDIGFFVWAQDERRKASNFPTALDEFPPPSFAAFFRQALEELGRSGRGDADLRHAYRAYLASPWARDPERKPPAPFDGFARLWRKYVPDQGSARGLPAGARPLEIIPHRSTP